MLSVSTSFVPKSAKKIFATAAVALLSSSDVNLSCHGSDLAESQGGRVYGLKLSLSRASTEPGETPQAKIELLNNEIHARVAYGEEEQKARAEKMIDYADLKKRERSRTASEYTAPNFSGTLIGGPHYEISSGTSYIEVEQ